MPMAIKDLANVKGFKTTEGSPLYSERVAQKDDQMVARLGLQERCSLERQTRLSLDWAVIL